MTAPTPPLDPVKLAKASQVADGLLQRRREMKELCKLMDWSYEERTQPWREAIRTVCKRSGKGVLNAVSSIKATLAEAKKELNEIQGSLLLCAALEELEAEDADG